MGDYYIVLNTEENSLEHHGILGQRWGVRRYQNKDGSLTSAGKKRYITNEQSRADRAKEEAGKAHRLANKYTSAMDKKADKRASQAENAKPYSYKVDRANRAKEEAGKAHRLANKYTSAMDKKADKRQRQADEKYEKMKSKGEALNSKGVSIDDLKKIQRDNVGGAVGLALSGSVLSSLLKNSGYKKMSDIVKIETGVSSGALIVSSLMLNDSIKNLKVYEDSKNRK